MIVSLVKSIKTPATLTRAIKASLLVLLLTISANALHAADEQASLIFKTPSSTPKTLTISAINESIQAETVELFDPHLNKAKHYKGWKLIDILKLGFEAALDDEDLSDAVFVALDGYTSSSTKAKLLEEGGYVVFEDLDSADDWELIGRHRANPGPFYLVWTEEHQSSGYPWPWQLASISLNTFEQRFPKVVPTDADASSPVYAGYQTFREYCLSCHAINGQGGKVGPDLNQPKNILEYRAAATVRAFIVDASQFRESRMPPHPDFSEQTLDNLLDYLWHVRKRALDD